METSDILLLLFCYSINFYIVLTTVEIIDNLKDNDMISDEKQNKLVMTTLLLPILGYFLVRKIEITNEY